MPPVNLQVTPFAAQSGVIAGRCHLSGDPAARGVSRLCRAAIRLRFEVDDVDFGLVPIELGVPGSLVELVEFASLGGDVAVGRPTVGGVQPGADQHPEQKQGRAEQEQNGDGGHATSEADV